MSNNDNNDFFDVLREYGIEFDFDVTKDKLEDLFKEGYEKIPDEAKESIDSLLQYIPGLATEVVERKDAIIQSKKMLDGAYKVSITEGMHLAKSKATEGAYRGALLSNSTNQVSGQAELFKINEQLKLPQAPLYALSVFDTVSAVTGQYYMAEINHKLSSIENKTDRILSFLDNQIKGDLCSIDQTLNEIICNMDFILQNDTEKMSYLNEVISIKREVLSKINFFKRQIDESKENVEIKSKEKDLSEEIKKITTYFPEYWYAVYLYAKAVACEIVLAKVDDPQDLSRRKDNVLSQVENYREVLEDSKTYFTSVIKKSKAYNKKKLPILRTRSYGHPEKLELIYNVVAELSHIYSDKRSQRGKETLQKFQSSMKECEDIKILDEQVIKIEEHINRLCNPVDIIQIDGETYIRYRIKNDNDEEETDKF